MNTQTATTAHKGKPRVEREAALRWVPIDLMRVSPQAQRDLNQARVDKIASEMDLEQLGYPYVSHRDGYYWIIDGQHRMGGFKKWEPSWKGQQIQCFTYEGLTEEQEAEMFLKLNDQLAVSTFEKFKVGLRAGRTEELAIAAIVSHLGMNISKQRSGLSISAVGTLRKVFRAGGPKTLRRTLYIIREAYGQAGLEAPVIEGLGLVIQRYGEQLEDDRVITALSYAAAGVSGLLNSAQVMRKAMGQRMAHCVAAAVVELIRKRRGGTRIKEWWAQVNGDRDGATSSQLAG